MLTTTLLRRLLFLSAVGITLLFSLLSPFTSAGEGRVDATNGDVFFNAHFRFPPTTQQIADVKSALDLMAFGMCDATDGQLRVKQVTLSQGQPNEAKGDFWLHALPGRSGLSFFLNGANLGNLGSHVDMFSGAIFAPDVYLHEFGHHAWGLGDEYDEQARFGGACGIGPSFDAGTIDERNHSIMQQSGSAQCVGGANNGASCKRNSECPAAGGGAAGTCQLVRMSELSVATNHDLLQGNGFNCPTVGCDNAYCQRVFNTTTNRFERTQQSELHNGESDWVTLRANYPFVTVPAGLPTEVAAAGCFRPVTYVENVQGSDQVLLILDRSGSMAYSSRLDDQEVCGNGADDDGDGGVDETTCGDPRINFVRGAANAYLDLQRDRNVDVGILSFDDTNTLDLPIATLNAGNIAIYKGIVNALVPGGGTGIGDALDASTTEFTRVATLGRSRTAYLMTDGYNTSGGDPVAAAARLRDIGVTVHVIPAGSDVSPTQLGGVAATTGGDLFPVPAANELAAAYAELAGRHRGAALALSRTNFDLYAGPRKGEENNSKLKVVKAKSFPIYVEKNAKSLTAFVSGRNTHIADWAMNIELHGPNGEYFGPGSSALTVSPYYLFIDVPGPSEGTWKLVATVNDLGLQQGTALAFIDNPAPDFFVTAKPTIATPVDKIQIAASPSFVSRLGSKGVTIKGQLKAPDGSLTALALSQNVTGAWSTETGPFSLNGFYQATLNLDVDSSASLAEGESIFSGPATPPVTLTPFKRSATTGFIVVKGKREVCISGNTLDCDSDGFPDKEECAAYGKDIDKDGRLNGYDPDADGDEIPDAVEGLFDRNQNKIPDMCEYTKPKEKIYTKSLLVKSK